MPKGKKYSKKYKKRFSPLEIAGNTFRIENGKLILSRRGKSLKPQHLDIINAYAKKHHVKSFTEIKPIEQTTYDIQNFLLFSQQEYNVDELVES